MCSGEFVGYSYGIVDDVLKLRGVLVRDAIQLGGAVIKMGED